MDRQNNEQAVSFDSISIKLASPDKIREWSYGVVEKPETINYRTLKPEPEGLFCERIFGPTKDWECHCGKYKRIRYKGVKCNICGVEVTKSKVRRERMGHIELAAPVSHIWYFKGIPSRMGILLGMSPRALEQVLYFAQYVVLKSDNYDPEHTPKNLPEYKSLLTEAQYREAVDRCGYGSFRVGMGAEAIKELLQDINLEEEAVSLREEVKGCTGQKRVKLMKKLEVVQNFLDSGNKPEWMILDALPVSPPDLRPMVQLDGGRFATSDLNDLYRRVINRNNRLRKLLELHAPDIIVRNEKRMLQEAVDALIDNGRRGRPVTGPSNRSLKSLSDSLKGKQGRFRQNLLGKRVDYSGRSVIVVGPSLKIYQCGLPKEMAIELFKPFVMRKLVQDEKAHNIKSAKRMVERLQEDVWDVLEEVIKEHPVMLNRAPTLHRLGIQAFEPVLVEGRAIKLHPLVCTAYNADFDGDQMAVHVPLSVEAQAECRFLMLSPNNLLKPSDGEPVTVPTQDMVLGIYYLTLEKPGEPGEGKIFKDENEALMAYDNHVISLHTRVKVRRSTEVNGEAVSALVETTPGRIIFNEIIPQDLGFVDRSDTANLLKYEVDFLVTKKELGQIIKKCINRHSSTETAVMLDDIKSLGYKFSTRGALTVSVSDMEIPDVKEKYLAEADEQVNKITKVFRRGLMTDEERHNQIISVWEAADDKITAALMDGLGEYNNIFMMANSGARGSKRQIKQLAGMRGLMASPSGETIELPIRANFREGLSVQEYFISAHGARKGLSDTALRTADSGYLTRRLVDVSQDVIIRDHDCASDITRLPIKHIAVTLKDRENVEPIIEKLVGNYAVEDMYNKATGVLVVDKDTRIDYNQAEVIAKAAAEEASKSIDAVILTVREVPGMWVSAFVEGNETIELISSRIRGRFTAADILDPATGKVIVPVDTMISPDQAEAVEAAGVKRVKIRTMLTCRAHDGVCSKCYGANMASGRLVRIGEAVGIIAAQSIGEPGTQLTMRTFHTGGVSGNDLTQGLPRVEELFEARKPKGVAKVTEIGGKVEITPTEIIVKGDTETRNYHIDYGSRVRVMDGDVLEAGDPITEGPINPHDLISIDAKGVRGVQDYIIKEVQRVYRLQGVDIDDKHIEVIVRQMLKRYKVEDSGDTGFLPGSLVDWLEFEEANARMEAQGLEPATGKRSLLGITKASLATDSFLSAASFQETTKVLTEAAIKGKTDKLIGLKENVIIGKLIPAGTGMEHYRQIELKLDKEEALKAQMEADRLAYEQAQAEAQAASEAAEAEEAVEAEAFDIEAEAVEPLIIGAEDAEE